MKYIIHGVLYCIVYISNILFYTIHYTLNLCVRRTRTRCIKHTLFLVIYILNAYMFEMLKIIKSTCVTELLHNLVACIVHGIKEEEEKPIRYARGRKKDDSCAKRRILINYK